MPAPKNGRKHRQPCPACGKVFQPMTDAMWRSAWHTHQEFSVRHRRAVGKTPRPTKSVLAQLAKADRDARTLAPPALNRWR